MRTPIKQGTIIKLPSGSSYQIIGAPIGSGGGSLLYPAARVIRNEEGTWEQGAIRFAIKECFPFSSSYSFVRSDSGEIISEGNHEEANRYLAHAREMQIQEEKITGAVYEKGFRLIPTLESAEGIELSGDGSEFHKIRSTVTIMESLDQKGQSLHALMKESRRLNARQTLKIIEQILLAVREVHEAGYLHLDIQDGNIFMRGTLEDESSLVSLIDFSAARKLEDDGKTAEIEDRVIYSTQGFTPPEILNKNDGSLRLGKEADIYEIGCLLVLLLTGHPIYYERTYLSDGAKSIKPYEMKRTDCPAHLQERLNGLITTALRNEPDDRYHDCDGMLAVVRDLLDAMQTHKSAISQMDYDAFVCYRHSENDSAAAVALQRALERYKAPRSIGKKRTIGRVFVDEGELSSCADFGEQIREALKNAQWLLVVCSPQTRESPWVNLEIDTFLEYHDRSRILAVLTEGEPEDSFPEELLKKTEGEVFAADARGTTVGQIKKKIKGDALLRIAAPMLGTTFDSLKQRQKTYRIRRAAATSAAALAILAGFFGYAVHQNKVLDSTTQDSLANEQKSFLYESKVLVKEAQEKIEEGDYLSAITILLDGITSNGKNVRVSPETQGLLTKALGTYETMRSRINKAQAQFQPEYRLDPFFFLDSTEEHLFVREFEGCRLFICDPKSMKCNYTIETKGIIECCSEETLNEELQMIVLCEAYDDETSIIRAFSYKENAQVWQFDSNGKVRYLTFLSEQVLFAVTENAVVYINARTGEETLNIPIEYSGLLPNNIVVDSIDMDHFSLSENKEWCAWTLECKKLESTQRLQFVITFDTTTNEIYSEIIECGTIAATDFSSNSFVYIIGASGESQVTQTGNSGYGKTSFTDYPKRVIIVQKLSINNLHTEWRTEHEIRGGDQILYQIDGLDNSPDTYGFVIVCTGNTCIMLNEDTGERLHTYNTPEEIYQLGTGNEALDKVGAGCGAGLNLKDGSVENIVLLDYDRVLAGKTPDFDKCTVVENMFVHNALSLKTANGAQYVAHSGGVSEKESAEYADAILRYDNFYSDYGTNVASSQTNEQLLNKEDYTWEENRRSAVNADGTAAVFTKNDTVMFLTGNTREEGNEVPIGGVSDKDEVELLGLDTGEDAKAFLYQKYRNNSNHVVSRILQINKKWRTKEHEITDGEHDCDLEGIQYHDGSVYYAISENRGDNTEDYWTSVFMINTDTWENSLIYERNDREKTQSDFAVYPITVKGKTWHLISELSQNGHSLYVIKDKGSNGKTGDKIELDFNTHPEEICRIDALDETAVLCDESLFIIEDSLEVKMINSIKNYPISSMLLRGNSDLLLLDKKGSINLLDLKTEQIKMSESIEDYDIEKYNIEYNAKLLPGDQDTVFIELGNGEKYNGQTDPRILYIVSIVPDHCCVLAMIDEYLAMDRAKHIFYTCEADSGSACLRWYPYFSLEELTKMAEEKTENIHTDTGIVIDISNRMQSKAGKKQGKQDNPKA